MTKIRNITDYLDEIFPPDTAEGYDNPGLMTGERDREVTSAVLSLDATSGAIRRCIETGSNLLIAHHPLIFGGISTVSLEDTNGRLLSAMIKNDITCFAAHTNLDKASEFSNFVLARKLCAVPGTVREIEGASCGAFYELPEETRLGDYIKTVVRTLDSSGAISINPADSKVKRIFVQGGAFDEDSIPFLVENEVDLVISGEIKHHVTLLLAHQGIKSLIAGHNATERIFMENLETHLEEKFPEVVFYYEPGDENALN